SAHGFAPLKNDLFAWANEPLSSESRDRFLSALASQQRDVDPQTADIVPVSGTVWIRRARSNATVPCSSTQTVVAGSALLVPSSARAQVYYKDGSVLLVDGGTDMRIMPG